MPPEKFQLRNHRLPPGGRAGNGVHSRRTGGLIRTLDYPTAGPGVNEKTVYSKRATVDKRNTNSFELFVSHAVWYN